MRLFMRIGVLASASCLASATQAIDLLVPQEYASIQAAVNASSNGDRVVIAPGTYNEQVTINAKSITVAGSGGPNVTKIDRQNAGGHVFNVTSVAGTPVRFEGLTITRCQGNAIQTTSSLVEISNVRVTFGSRAILLEQNSTLDATDFQAIVMSAPGAGVYINGPGGIANLINCNFQDGGNTNGGALYCNSGNGQFTVADTTFAFHTGVNAGSVFLVPGSSGTFTNCVWSNCEGGTASCVYAQGSASVTIDNCSMLQNRGTCFYSESGSLVVKDSLQEGSYGDYRYSFLRNNSGPTIVERCTSRSSLGYIDCNEQGGWIYAGSGSLLIEDCEATGFRLRGDSGCNGGGLVKAANSGSSITIRRTLFSLASTSVNNSSFLKIVGRPAVVEDCDFGFDPGSTLTHYRGIWLEGVPSSVIERCDFLGHQIVHAVDSVNSNGLSLRDCSFSAGSPTSNSIYPIIFRGSGHVSQQLLERCTFNRMRQSIRFENNTNAASSLTIRECRFLDNLRENEASAVWCQGVAPLVDGCVFRSLEFPSIYTNTYVVLRNSFFCGNQGQELNTAVLEKGGNVFNAPCSIDCDADGLPDEYEIAVGMETDCNSNDLPDSCDADAGGDCDKDEILDICEIAAGAPDCNLNGILDTCEPDCDSDGVPNACEIASGATDCDANGIPDTCQPDCDSDATIDACEIAAGAADCNANAVPDSCEIAAGTAPDLNTDAVIDTCQPEMQFAGLELEIVPIVNRGLDDLFPATSVCYRLYARTTEANSAVVGLFGNPDHPLAINATGGFWQSPYGGDLASAVPCDLSAALPSAKYDSWFTIGLTCALGNSVQNTGMNLGPFNKGGGVNDNDGIIFVNPGAPQSIAGPTKRVLLAQLTTRNAVLPTGTVDVIGRSAAGTATWTAFAQAIPVPALVDCNANGVQDAFDIANATSYDCDQSGVPDTCEYGSASTDCNVNGIPDLCDVTSAFSPDQNGNFIPDECECMGDVDANGRVDVDDIIDVIAAWGTIGDHPADVNNDQVVDSQDLVIVLSGYGSCL